MRRRINSDSSLPQNLDSVGLSECDNTTPDDLPTAEVVDNEEKD